MATVFVISLETLGSSVNDIIGKFIRSSQRLFIFPSGSHLIIIEFGFSVLYVL